MTDENIRDVLNRAFVDEPPLRFERGQIVARGRRFQRKRRLVVAGSALASVAVVTAGIAIIAGFSGAAGRQIAPGGPGSSNCVVVSPSSPEEVLTGAMATAQAAAGGCVCPVVQPTEISSGSDAELSNHMTVCAIPSTPVTIPPPPPSRT